MTRPEVSVVIPTRDRWRMLEACGLRSALSQTRVEVEVIVVDDGSRDETAAELDRLRDSRVHVLRHDMSKGRAAARNAGIAAARGDWLAFLDDDDLWSPVKLRRQLDRAAETDVLVCTGVLEIDESLNPLQMRVPGPTTRDALLGWNTIPAGSSTVMARADDVRAVGGLDERLTYVEDWDLWIRLAARGGLAVVPEVLVAYVRHGSGSRFAGRHAVDEMQYFVKKHEPSGLRADPAAFLWWVAMDNRLDGRRLAAASTYLRTALTYRRPRRALRAFATLLEPRGRKTMRSWAARSQPPISLPDDVPWLASYR
ncbi:MAG: glycosyltransferase family 2 protein [Actinomycetota bacterium]|nr:glycosyltransferase family 2 protein [Actinomycetota bacterium]